MIYELDDYGNIIQLGEYRGLPTDENYLNDGLEKSGEVFGELLKIENLCYTLTG